MLFFDKLVDGIFLVRTDDKFVWTCQGILIKNVNGSGNVLIDCNFSRRDLKQLLKELDGEITAYFATHTHLDHVNNLHHLQRLLPEVKIYCPIPEHEYLLDISKFTDVNGAEDFGVAKQMQNTIHGFMKFKELKSVKGFEPGSSFTNGGMTLKTIHLQGHSPGHVAVIIENEDKSQRKILFATDMGLDDFGPWYGFKYNSIEGIRKDVEKIEDIYLNDDFILTSGHGQTFFKKKPEIFQGILKKVEEREVKLLKMFDDGEPKELEDLALKGLIYSLRSLQKYKVVLVDGEKLLLFWEGFFILNLIQDLIEKGQIREIGTRKWILVKN